MRYSLLALLALIGCASPAPLPVVDAASAALCWTLVCVGAI